MLRIGTILLFVCIVWMGSASAQNSRTFEQDAEFGPVVRAYLGYLRAEQEVTDARESRHEISPAYYRRNSNRIRALRQMAIQIARETNNDYLPELEAVAQDEMHSLFEDPPKPPSLRVGAVINNTFRFLGAVRSGETFYLFARLDPYEQAELMKKAEAPSLSGVQASAHATGGEAATSRPRRVGAP